MILVPCPVASFFATTVPCQIIMRFGFEQLLRLTMSFSNLDDEVESLVESVVDEAD